MMENAHEYLQIINEELLIHPPLQRIVLAALLAAFSCSLLSGFVVLKRMAFAGQSISHIAFAGLAFGLWLSPAMQEPNLLIYGIAAAWTLIFALVIAFTSQARRLSEDSALGIYFTAAIALGILFMHLRGHPSSEIFAYLFGTMITVTPLDLQLLGGVAALIFLAWLFYNRDWFAFCLDPQYAKFMGVKTSFLQYFLFLLISVAVVISIKVMGVLFVIAMLILPGCCARLMTLRFNRLFLLSIVVALLSTLAGIAASMYWLDYPPVLFVTAILFSFFFLLLLLSRLRNSLQGM